MKIRMFFLLCVVVLLVGCEKDETDNSPENYLKATIDGKSFTAYEDGVLNNDTVPNTFAFSFGQTVTDKKDTCLFIAACLNRNNVHISFPKPTGKKAYPIYCKSNISGQASAFYTSVPNYAAKNGLKAFLTQNVLSIDSIEGRSIGEVVIDRLDTKNRLIEGHFNFNAYGYNTLTEIYVLAGDSVKITNGEFYYAWDESLDLY
jgi:hypothetical protein